MTTQSYIILEQYGCAVRVAGKSLSLQTCSLVVEGGLEGGGREEYWGEVSAPDSQNFLDAANKALGTNFTMQDFPGR